jgi:hypothetical protein
MVDARFHRQRLGLWNPGTPKPGLWGSDVNADDLILDTMRRSSAVTFDDLVRALRPRGVKLGAINLWLTEARAAGVVEDAGRRHVDGPRGVRQFKLAGTRS